jgi:hypothetical protein
MIGVPLAWAVLLAFHPGGDPDSIYLNIQDEVTRWQVVHIGMLIFIPLMGGVVYLLLRGIEGTAALVSRIGLAFFVAFYSAWEVLQGIANGVLTAKVNGLSSAEDRAVGADLIQEFAESPLVRDLGVFAAIGSLGLVTAMVAAGIALHRRAGAPASVAVLLGLAGLLITAHPPPFGPLGLVLFVAAVILFARSGASAGEQGGVRAPAPDPAPPVGPAGAPSASARR